MIVYVDCWRTWTMTVRVVKKSAIFGLLQWSSVKESTFLLQRREVRGFGPPHLRGSMRKMRYNILLKSLRFYDKGPSSERRRKCCEWGKYFFPALSSPFFLNLYKLVGYYCISQIWVKLSIIFSKAQPITLTFVTKAILIFLYYSIDIVYEKWKISWISTSFFNKYERDLKSERKFQPYYWKAHLMTITFNITMMLLFLFMK